MSDETIRITPEDLLQEEPIIKLTEKDLKSPEKERTTVVVDGEEISVPAEVVIGWKDILRAETHNPSHVDLKMPLSESDETEYDHEVISNLKEDVRRLREDGKSERQIYRELAIRYHPDLYQNEGGKIRLLAQSYMGALTGLRNAGELK